MSRTPTILPFILDSKKHVINLADPATRTHASIATTKGSTFHTSSQKSAWIIDSGATDHMTFDPSQLISRKSSTMSAVSNANGTPSPVVGEGSLSLSTSLHLDSVLLVPSLDHNLLSIAQLTTTLECTVTFWLNHCVFQDILTGKTINCGTRQGKLYYLDWAPDNEVKGPAKIATPAGARWFVMFINDCTCMTWVSLLKTKGEVSSRFQQFYQMVETQFHARIQVLRSDNDGEFLNHDLNQFLQDHDIIHQRSCPYTPQQNGVLERKNRRLLEIVRASLFGANMPRSFWGEAVVSAAYRIN
ncbi:hypothetical protein L3X38_027501 [Prunus dulcis]|uniref:Integrase catalytic domain-containing protein n=1 Tax=Prunus dulcis TaxID=3755 RepID=A0AAD4Z0E3_PRUDU|nr:hypothetical protein L3X38_027501 [Prunus dulcis]